MNKKLQNVFYYSKFELFITSQRWANYAELTIVKKLTVVKITKLICSRDSRKEKEIQLSNVYTPIHPYKLKSVVVSIRDLTSTRDKVNS